MKREQEIVLLLVGSALWNRPIEALPDDIDWVRVYELAVKQTVTGLLADSLKLLPEGVMPPDSVLQRLRHFRINSIRTHALLNSRLADVLAILKTKGIDPVLFKGQGLALNYPDPTARQCGDIDLYVGKDYDAACAAAYDSFGAQDHDSESIKHMHLSYKGVEVELHKIAESIPGISKDRKYQEWTLKHLYGDQIRKVTIESSEVQLPPYQFDCIYVLNHLWHHFITGGVGLRQVCDWTVYLHAFHDKIDVNTLERDLRDFGLLKVWKIFAYIAVNQLGLPAEECPLYEDSERRRAGKVLCRIFEEGNFGRHSEHKATPRPKGYAAGKLHSFYYNTSRYLRLIGVVPDFAFRYYTHYLISGIYHYFKGLR